MYSIDSEEHNGDSELDCSRFRDDFDILRQIPFPITINPNVSADYQTSTVRLSGDQSFVKSVIIKNGNTVPLIIYCLSKIDELHIEKARFENGNS